jgi:DUF2934 family protein
MELLQNEIAQLAYELYEINGRIEGRDLANWVEAERIITAKHQLADWFETEKIRIAKENLEENEINSKAEEKSYCAFG